MNIDAIADSPIGQLVPIYGFDQRTGKDYEHAAFLPSPLPAAISLQSETWTTVARAEAALGRLDEASQQLPDPGLLRHGAIRREAQSTSALEGTFAPFEDVLEPDLEDRATRSLEVWEILNYVAAAEQGFQWIESRPITAGLLSELQRTLVMGTPGQYSDAGSIRDRQVVIGPRDSSVVDSRFTPPPPGDQLRTGVDQWVEWIRQPPGAMPPVVRAALAHYQFESLHPFSDGNGRIGRLLIVLQLMRDGVLREPILVVSPWFEAQRDDYQNQLLALSQRGDWDEWVRFFTSGVAEAANAFRLRIGELIDWRDSILHRVRDAGISGIAERITGELIGSPVLSAARVARTYGVSQQGAMNALRRLVDAGVLVERPRRGRRSFTSEGALELLSFRF